MAKKKRKRPGKRKKRPSPPEDRSLSGQLKRARKYLGTGQEVQAVATLDEVWPPTQESARKERMRWLLHHWPGQCARELEAAPPKLWRQETFWEELAGLVLMWDKPHIRLLREKGFPWIEEGLEVRKAHELLLQGEDEAAMGRLRRIGLRSPYRDARLFLRGLSSYYQGHDDDAIKSLSRLTDSWAYGSASNALLGLLDPSRELPRLPATLAKALQPPSPTERETLTTLRRLLETKKSSHMLRELNQRWHGLSSLCRTMLWRDLPGSLLSLGLRPDDVITRLKRAISPPPDDPKAYRLKALLYEHSEDGGDPAEVWGRYIKQFDKKQIPWPEDQRPLATAALLARQAHQLAEQASELEMELEHNDFFAFLAPEPGPIWREATKCYERSIELDPSALAPWKELLTLKYKQQKKDDAYKLLDQMVKQFPDEPEVCAMAASAAMGRGTFDKALRYIQKAITAAPLVNSYRDTQAHLLLAKARKKYHEKRPDITVKLHHQVRAMPHITMEPRLKAYADSVAMMEARGYLDIAKEIYQEAPKEWGWMWVARYFIARYMLSNASNSSKGKTKQPKTRPLPEPDPLFVQTPDEAPGEEEFRLLVVLHRRTHSGGISLPQWTRLLLEAATQQPERIASREDAEYLLDVATEPTLRLTIAERGQQIAPKDPALFITRYRTALELRRPHDYFARFDEEFESFNTAISLDDILNSDTLSNPLELMEQQVRLAEYFEELEALERDVGHYLNPSGRRKPKRKRNQRTRRKY